MDGYTFQELFSIKRVFVAGEELSTRIVGHRRNHFHLVSLTKEFFAERFQPRHGAANFGRKILCKDQESHVRESNFTVACKKQVTVLRLPSDSKFSRSELDSFAT